MDLHQERKNYALQSIDFKNIPVSPFSLFEKWFLRAKEHAEILEANAVTLATVDANMQPSSRVVLLKAFGESEGFVLYTNYLSEKGRAMACNPKVCLSFFWPPLQQQVHIQGAAKKIRDELSADYFAQRPRGSQLGAVLSQQSQDIPLDLDVEKAADELAKELADQAISKPANWGGYRIEPLRFEFWQGRPSRLHDRLLYSFRQGNWQVSRKWA